jgi:hypothetical protein
VPKVINVLDDEEEDEEVGGNGGEANDEDVTVNETTTSIARLQEGSTMLLSNADPAEQFSIASWEYLRRHHLLSHKS